MVLETILISGVTTLGVTKAIDMFPQTRQFFNGNTMTQASTMATQNIQSIITESIKQGFDQVRAEQQAAATSEQDKKL